MTSQLEEAVDHEPSVVSVVSGLVNDAEKLVKQEFELLKVEIKSDARQMAIAAIPMIAGVLACGVGMIVLAFALAHVLIAVWPSLPVWAAYGIVAVVIITAGVVAVWRGKEMFTEPIRDVLEPAKEDRPWTVKK
jgi:uncharacterized membrane protein YqjE